MTNDASAPTPFADLDQYIALPRISGLVLSPDGRRLVSGVARLNDERTGYTTALWEIDPAGLAEPRQLTRSAKGESSPAFTVDGDLLFVSGRSDGDHKAPEDAPPALWLLPVAGGEARVIATRPGGVAGIVRPPATSDSPRIAIVSPTMPSAVTEADDKRIRSQRKDLTVSAILHSGYPVRYWDHDLGPEEDRLFLADTSAPEEYVPEPAGDETARADASNTLPGGRYALRDLTPAPGRALDEVRAAISPDGRTLYATWRLPEARGSRYSGVVAIDLDSGERTLLVDDDSIEVYDVIISPDGSALALVAEERSTPERAVRLRLEIVSLADGTRRTVAEGWDRWPGEVAWLPGSGGLLVVADEDGRAPVFRIDLDGDVVTRLTTDIGAYTNLCVAPDGSAVYALRSSYAEPPHPVRIDLTGPAGTAERAPRVTPLPLPFAQPALSGTLTEIETTAEDGTRVRGWLAMPAGADAAHPAPLLLWIHGGPLASWNAWSWRWNPWLLVERGYAVLLPDPALSTGYGQDFVQRGWASWGKAPFTDLMAITDAAERRDDVDASRTAAMGGSFGGYMANWVAGHTDRFRAIVTHASLWALDQFGLTTDGADYWQRELSAEDAMENSPHLSVDRIDTPMLVIHGDRDYRVPIGDGLRLWYELLSKSKGAVNENGETPHRFLYFPNENHWVLSPQHAKVWYETVFAFLSTHVLGEPADPPATLG